MFTVKWAVDKAEVGMTMRAGAATGTGTAMGGVIGVWVSVFEVSAPQSGWCG